MKKWDESIAKEDMKAKQARLAREKTQQQHPVLGSSSRVPVVYLWEEDIETGFLLRKSMSQGKVRATWGDYTNSQRHYDSTTNQWDICEELDPGPKKAMSFTGGDPYIGLEDNDDFRLPYRHT